MTCSAPSRKCGGPCAVSMIKSMTGFGRLERAEGERKYTVEIKSVNHRYLDLNIRMPKALSALEPDIRMYLKNRLGRGKVDVYVGYEDFSQGKTHLCYNEALAEAYVKYAKEMAETFALKDSFDVSALMQCPNVLVEEEAEADESLVKTELQKTLEGALDAFVSSREKEGAHLQKDLLGKLSEMEKDVAYIEERGPEIVKDYQKGLYAKVEEVLGDAEMDEARILQEVVIYSDKICTDEEVVRLKSHMMHMKESLLESRSGIGRELDFIAQEMNRESNTILSKANDIDTASHAISLKTAVEKIREQIQNIE